MKKFFLFLLILFIFFFISCKSPIHYNDNLNTSFTENSSNYCLIDLRGEVVYPGIYKVKEGTLINDIIELAGGFTKNANIANISLVNIITSNTKIVIPSILDSTTSTNDLININFASLNELMLIPKIGEVKAIAIIDYRTINGEFKNIEEIKNVAGIGETLYETIKTYITV